LIVTRHEIAYNVAMGAKLRSNVLDEILEPIGNCLTPEVARRLVKLRAPPEDQRRMEELANKCDNGELSADEQAEYDTRIMAGNFIAILKAKARRLLSGQNAA
jgi:hypothetical protein